MSVYKFADIAFNSTEKKKPEPEDKNVYIGLEHLDPGILQVTRYGAEVAPKGDKLVMKKGDVLFGRRRAYQKKVGIAPFDGIFSAHGMVLRPKTDVIDPGFFPFFISSDCFLDEAIRVSVGSLSPTANWKDLKELQFELPSRDEQRAVAEIMRAAAKTKAGYRALLDACDDLVKSQFVEMFGSANYPLVTASGFVLGFRNGISPSKKGGVHSKVLTLSAVTQGRFDPSSWKDGTFKETPPADKRVSGRDFYICRGNGNKRLVGTAAFADKDYPDLVFPDTLIAAAVDDSKIDRTYLSCAWAQPAARRQIEASARTTNGTFKINQEVVGGVRIPLPPLGLQQEFADFVAQVDKSKFR